MLTANLELSNSREAKRHVSLARLAHARHELLQRPLAVIFVNEQHFFDCVLLEAHLIKLVQKAQELGSLRKTKTTGSIIRLVSLV